MASLRVQVAVPHFFREGASVHTGGYGSGRIGNRLPRSLSLSRCLGSLLSLNRSRRDWILNIAERHLELTPASTLSGLPEIKIDLHLFVCGDNWLEDVVDIFQPRLHLHHVSLDDPQHLPLTAVRFMLENNASYDLSIYSEDDLVFADSYYVDKYVWFYEQTNHEYVLMPHRIEPSVANAPQSLYVDGPIKPDGYDGPVWSSDQNTFAKVRFWNNQIVEFSRASNPHSGSFCVSKQQISVIKSQEWPPQEFVGPLETAATGTVFPLFPVLKTSWKHRDFLKIEHSNPSFLTSLNSLPRRELSS